MGTKIDGSTTAPPAAAPVAAPALVAPPPRVGLAVPVKANATIAKEPDAPGLGKAATHTAAALQVGPPPRAYTAEQAAKAMAHALGHLPQEASVSAWEVGARAASLAEHLSAATHAAAGHAGVAAHAVDALPQLLGAVRAVTVKGAGSPLLGRESRDHVLANFSKLLATLPRSPALKAAQNEQQAMVAEYRQQCTQETADAAFRAEGLQALVTLVSTHGLEKSDLRDALFESATRLQHANGHGDIVANLQSLASAVESDQTIHEWMQALLAAPANPTIPSAEAALFQSLAEKVAEVPLEAPQTKKTHPSGT